MKRKELKAIEFRYNIITKILCICLSAFLTFVTICCVYDCIETKNVDSLIYSIIVLGIFSLLFGIYTIYICSYQFNAKNFECIIKKFGVTKKYNLYDVKCVRNKIYDGYFEIDSDGTPYGVPNSHSLIAYDKNNKKMFKIPYRYNIIEEFERCNYLIRNKQ